MKVKDLQNFLTGFDENLEVTIPLSDDRIEVRDKDEHVLGEFMIFENCPNESEQTWRS